MLEDEADCNVEGERRTVSALLYLIVWRLEEVFLVFLTWLTVFAAGAFEAAESAEVFAAFVLRGFAAVVVLALESVSALRFGGILSDGFFKSKSRKESASCR